MSTAMGSFDKSPLDAFVKSPLDARNAPEGKILFWAEGVQEFPSGSEKFIVEDAAYREAGLAVDDQLDWSGSLADYQLVFLSLVFPASPLPSWWVDTPSWSGRMVISEDYPPSIGSTLPQILALTGLGFVGFSDSIGQVDLSAVHPLTNGMTTGFFVARTSLVSGGTPLLQNTGRRWMAERTVVDGARKASYILAGNRTWIRSVFDHRGASLENDLNVFLLNLVRVPVGA